MRHNQNRRSRGRSNNRKGPNPLTRSYESNGPDVKVRGTAPHVAEKYMSLARDALASGDNVAAENYLQHAEHYNRIVAAAQLQLQQTQPQQFREAGSDDEAEEDRAPRGRDRFGYYTDPEGEEDGFDTGVGDDESMPASQQQRPPQQQPRQDFRNGQDNRGPDNREGRGDGGQNRQDRQGYQGDRPRRDNRDGYRDGRNDHRDARGDQGRGDYRDNRNDNRADNRNDNRGDNRPDRGDGRNERGDNRDFRGNGRNERFNGERPRQDFRDGTNEGSNERAPDEQIRPSGDAGRTQAGSEGAAEMSGAHRNGEDRGAMAAQQPERDEPRDDAAPGPEAAGDDAPRPRRRRAPRAAKAAAAEAGEAGDADVTRDGEAALAAFPE